MNDIMAKIEDVVRNYEGFVENKTQWPLCSKL